MVVILDMSRNDLLIKIKQAEQTAESSLEGVEKERSEALRNAETKGHSIISDARNKAEIKASKDLDNAKKDISKKKDKLLKEGMTDIKKMQSQASKKSEKAADNFVKIFLESVDA